jgi:hypothetical protein
MEDNDHETWLNEARALLTVARRKRETLEPALRRLCKLAFREFRFSPMVIMDYMVVSTPGVFGEAGFSDEEVDALMPTIDRIVSEEWAARNG